MREIRKLAEAEAEADVEELGENDSNGSSSSSRSSSSSSKEGGGKKAHKRRRRFDLLVVESTGISVPLPVAATFEFADEQGASLGQVARLDTLVTVVRVGFGRGLGWGGLGALVG